MSKKKGFKTKEFAWKPFKVLVRNSESALEAGRRNLKCHLCHKQMNDRYECVPCGIFLIFVQEDIKIK